MYIYTFSSIKSMNGTQSKTCTHPNHFLLLKENCRIKRHRQVIWTDRERLQQKSVLSGCSHFSMFFMSDTCRLIWQGLKFEMPSVLALWPPQENKDALVYSVTASCRRIDYCCKRAMSAIDRVWQTSYFISKGSITADLQVSIIEKLSIDAPDTR